MARPKDADSAETMSRILDAALAELRDQGEPTPPTLRSVARRADVSLGTIRYYFDTKDELLEACLDGYYNRLGTLSTQLLASAVGATDGRKLIEDTVRALYRFIRAERGLVALRLATNSSRGELHPRRQRDFMGTFIREAANALAPFVEVDHDDTRLSIQALSSVIVRFALLSDSERSVLTDVEGEAGEVKIEEFVVRAARRLLRPSDG
jgi:AcrR family transcriptional regulator